MVQSKELAEQKIEVIKSISFSQDEILRNIIKLYLNGNPIEIDATYSKGIFYRNIPKPIFKYDLFPQTDDTITADSRNLPHSDCSVGSIIFDPPFLATTGKSLQKDDGSNIIAKRFGYYRNEIELHTFYKDSLKEFYRIMKKDAVLIVKCQDNISGGVQYMSHIFIVNEAEKLGFYTEDLFILLAKHRLVAPWQIRSQQHARKFHSYFLVFIKKDEKVQYLINKGE